METFISVPDSPLPKQPKEPGSPYFEIWETSDGQVYTLVGHLPAKGMKKIGDFATKEAAEEACARIAGVMMTFWP